jgi:GR25 family glycosyltransferase involved in LPS biosynthesis
MKISHKIFHLEDAVERQHYFDSLNEYLNQYSTELSSVSIRISNQEEFETFIKDNPDFKLDFNGYNLDNIQGWRYGEVGVWASNFLAWKNFRESDSDIVILMEDDILFDPDMIERIKAYISELPESWEAFHFAVPSGQFHKYGFSLSIGQNTSMAYQDHWMLCYVLNKRGVQKCLDVASLGISLPLDWFFFRQRHLINSYTIKPESQTSVYGSPTGTTFQNQPRKIMTLDS